jgi:MFS family permease
MAIAVLCRAINLAIFIFAKNFLAFALGSALFGATLAFASGSTSAFIYDTLKQMKREKSYKKVEGKAFSYSLIAMGVGSFLGGMIAEKSLIIPLILTTITNIIAFFVAISLEEPKHTKKSSDTKYFTHLKDATSFTLRHPKVKWFVLFSGLMVSAMVISHKFVQPYLQLNGIALSYFGALYLIWLVSSAFVAKTAGSIEESLGENKSLMLMAVLLGAQFILMGKYVSLFGVLAIFLGQFVWGFIKPVIWDYINRHVESHHRATVLSLEGFAQSIIFIALGPVFGYLADYFSIAYALFIEGIVVLAAGFIIISLLNIPKNKA